jgi:epoxyqueuosine reductase
MLPALRSLAGQIARRAGSGGGALVFVDSGPLLERDAAERAGLGFIGRNTMLIRPGRGAWCFLGAALLAVELPADTRAEGGCGRCTRCIAACPTGALAGPYLLDARRCIGYITVEHKGAIPLDLRPLLGNRVFGCDECNDVCPYNRAAERGLAQAQAHDRAAPLLAELATMTEAGFRERFRGTALERTGRARVARNACVALGNWGAGEALVPLEAAIRDEHPLVRGHAAWALGRLQCAAARRALRAARSVEGDGGALAEMAGALVGAPDAGAGGRRTSA